MKTLTINNNTNFTAKTFASHLICSVIEDIEFNPESYIKIFFENKNHTKDDDEQILLWIRKNANKIYKLLNRDKSKNA